MRNLRYGRKVGLQSQNRGVQGAERDRIPCHHHDGEEWRLDHHHGLYLDLPRREEVGAPQSLDKISCLPVVLVLEQEYRNCRRRRRCIILLRRAHRHSRYIPRPCPGKSNQILVVQEYMQHHTNHSSGISLAKDKLHSHPLVGQLDSWVSILSTLVNTLGEMITEDKMILKAGAGNSKM
jgi:hypothetical protein